MLIDGLVLVALLALGLGSLCTPRLEQAAWLFVAFALVLSVAWLRLASPLIAIAELLLGAVLTGGLLLHTVHALRRGPGQ